MKITKRELFALVIAHANLTSQKPRSGEDHLLSTFSVAQADALLEALGERKDDGWVTLKEMVPEEGERCLLWIISEPPAPAQVIMGTWNAIQESFEHLSCTAMRITHWRPLPEAPGTEETSP